MIRSLDLETRQAALRHLARETIDRDGGDGSYQSMLDLVMEGGAGSAVAHRCLERVYERVERNLVDVVTALGAAGVVLGKGEAGALSDAA